ncbi:ATP-binding protein [Psychroflexus sp. CAK1W]|uniref:ATP-binding protein n=1 Tax=Psychroflexus curvus TaxID=2873595 RepID=UPI001CCD52BB|nr:ATP-binding protein [Psychroflexus curvus]MBZ9627446.1 ATP-binding protein [Psychroflexus curvus]
MREFTLKVPSSQKADDWFNFVKVSLKHSDKVESLIVDFNTVRFMETDDFVILACLIESFYINGCSVSFIGGTTNFNNHLFNIKFKEYWKEGFDRAKFTLSKNRTTLCLWKISEKMIYSYSNYAKEYFERFTKNKDLIPMSSNMDEVFNNIFDHSQSEVTGYIITQYYPKNNKISFSVCDFGVGIPKSIENADLEGKQKYEDWKAIVKSLEKGFSIKSTPRNRGFGLNNLLELTESSNGTLQIISNDGFFLKKAGEMYKVDNVNFDFKGTLIKVEIDLDTFEEKDESDDIFGF